MNKSLRFLSFAVAGTMAASLFFTGCTSSEHRRTAGQYFDDQALNARVKTALLQDEEVAGMDVSTTTFDGVVQLSGFVANPEQADRAADIAGDIPGVEEVVNNITVNPRAVQYGSPREMDEPEMKTPSDSDPQAEPDMKEPDFDAPSSQTEPDFAPPSADPEPRPQSQK